MRNAENDEKAAKHYRDRLIEIEYLTRSEYRSDFKILFKLPRRLERQGVRRLFATFCRKLESELAERFGPAHSRSKTKTVIVGVPCWNSSDKLYGLVWLRGLASKDRVGAAQALRKSWKRASKGGTAHLAKPSFPRLRDTWPPEPPAYLRSADC